MRLRPLVSTVFVLLASLAAHADNIVKNGGFETGDFSNWTVTNASSGTEIFVGGNARTGSSAAHFDGLEVGSYDSLSQALTTQAGASYQLSFALAEQFCNHQCGFQAYWDGSLLYDSLGVASSDYTLLSYSVAGSGSDTLLFKGYNVPDRELLDDVSVVQTSVAATPEPSSIALLGTGVLGIASVVRKRFTR